MQIKPLAPPLAAPASASPPDAASMSDASFAQQLQSRRSEAAAPAPKPTAHARHDDDTRRSEAAQRNNAARRDDAGHAAERGARSAAPDAAGHATAQTTAAKTEAAESRADVRARGPAGAGKTAPSPKSADAAIAREADADAPAAAPGDAAVPAAALAEWLARLAPPEAPGGAAPGEASAPELPGRAGAATAAAGDERSTASGQPLEALLARRAGIDKTVAAAADPAAHRIGAAPDDGRADPAAPSPTVLAAELHAEASAAMAVRVSHADAPQGGEAAPGHALATLGALGALGGAPHAAAPAAAATPTQVSIAAHFGTPAFAPALAASVSLLARDGVQEARLQLHPAELGPIAVQIALDGAQARVDFTAEVAATRHAIEAGLPELASALREAGLTLAGGGVFQQPRDAQHGAQQGGTNHAAQPRGPAGDARGDELPARSVAHRRVAVGGVDEYA